MPERAAEIRRAHLADVAEALRIYVEDGHRIDLETEFIAEDHGRIVITVDLSHYHPILQALTAGRLRRGASESDEASSGLQT